MNAILIGLLVIVGLSFAYAVIGVCLSPTPLPVRPPDPFLDELDLLRAEAAIDDAPQVATYGANEDLRNCTLPDAPSGKPQLAAGRMYAGRQHFGFIRGAL